MRPKRSNHSHLNISQQNNRCTVEMKALKCLDQTKDPNRSAESFRREPNDLVDSEPRVPERSRFRLFYLLYIRQHKNQEMDEDATDVPVIKPEVTDDKEALPSNGGTISIWIRR